MPPPLNNSLTSRTYPQEIAILADKSDQTATKAAIVLKALLEPYMTVDTTYVSSWKQVNYAVLHSSASTVVVYAFHGTEKGMHIGNTIITWHTIGKMIKSAPSYQMFLTCYSSILASISPTILLTSQGPTDYVISVLRAAFIIGDLCHNHLLLSSLASKVSSSQSSLLARLFFTFEPLWWNATHHFLTTVAITEVCNSIGWLNTILTQSTLLSTGITTTMLTNYTNPDYEDYPNGDPLTFNNVTDLMNTLVYNRSTLDIALRHVSFSATGSFHFQFPSWFYDPDIFSLITSNYGDSELWSLVEDLDSLDGAQDGTITYDTDIQGSALSRLLDRLDTAQEEYFSLSDYSWAQDLSRAAHYLQDQQVPYHTSLVDKDNTTTRHLDLIVSFSMKDTWVSIATQHGLTESYANWFYENKFEPLFRDYLAKNSTISWDLLEDFVWEAVGVLGFAYLLACFLGPLIALVATGLLVYNIADSTKDALYDFQDTLNSYITEIKSMLQAIEDNNKCFKTEHDFVEWLVDTYFIAQWYRYNWRTDISSYVHSNLATAHQWAQELLDPQQRTITVQNWITSSGDIANQLYHNVKPNKGTQQNQYYVLNPLKKRLKQAALQSTALYEAMFIGIIYKYDRDGDGIADLWEDKVFQTPTNLNTRTITIEQVNLIQGTMSSSKWEIIIHIEELRPWKNIVLNIGYQLSSTGAKVYTAQQSYTNQQTVYLPLGGGISLTTGTFDQRITVSLTFPVRAVEVKSIILSVTFYEWKLGSWQQLGVNTPLSFTVQTTSIFTSCTVGVTIPPELQRGL